MDFFKVKNNKTKRTLELYPDFIVKRSSDLMVRGKSFYAIWDEEAGLWSTDEYDVTRLVDQDLEKERDFYIDKGIDDVTVKYMGSYNSRSWSNFRRYMSEISNNYHQLDEKLTFSNTQITKKDYVSRRLPYPLKRGSIEAYKELTSVLYSPEEIKKIEWAIGSIISGESRHIQKFLVLFGEAGTGKSTILNIIQKLFEGYYTTFEAKALVSNNNAFSTEVFRANPLVAIQHDGDLSKIEDNTKLNSIVSHEEMSVNEKYKSSYTMRINCFLFMATNKPVKITDGRSGIIRRLIDVQPTGEIISNRRYEELMQQIEFELGAIAYHCLKVYEKLGRSYYNSYRPTEMMYKTDFFYNFVESMYPDYISREGIGLKEAYADYKSYCVESSIGTILPMYKFREELKNYFKIYHHRKFVDGANKYSYYEKFLADKFHENKPKDVESQLYSLEMKQKISLLDEVLSNEKAQYGFGDEEKPKEKWSSVNTVLSDLNTRKTHYVKLPSNHIVIDFDLKDPETGEKSKELNIEAASKWPPTYSEFSKSGKGIHLHYIYDGDVSRLQNLYAKDIEIKKFVGNASLRRKLSFCNEMPIATISSGLPLKGEKKVVDFDAVKSEKGLRKLIERNLTKEIHPGTKPSIDFIYKILEDAYNSGLKYDVTDMRPSIMAFANNSTNQSDYCVKLVAKMQFKSDEPSKCIDSEEDTIIFFDVEVFPNLFVVCWKKRGDTENVVRMINPTSKDIEELSRFKLIGFNNRRYDNHILYARMVGYDNHKLYMLSQKMINGSRNCMFGEAYNLSYADIYEFSSKKQSLKKFEIELGIHHQELGMKWDEEVPEEKWDLVADYCVNDVIATEATFEARYQDFVARQVLADLSGLSCNDTTQMHTAKIIFGDDPRPFEKFEYCDLSLQFPGYTFDNGKSFYRGEETGEGGYVYAEPGMYKNVALLDVASMHPTSLIQMNMFGPYTNNFKALLDARLAIKHKDYISAKKMLNGVFEKYLDSEEQSEALAYALKIVVNMVYGFTSTKFESKFRDPRNIDNIVAKRGALFMIDLKNAVQEKGYTVAHIKTDSIKIPDADNKIIEFVMKFGKKYGYIFEHEATYEKMCLVNDAVYIAKYKDGDWTATGAQFAQPYVFKTLFSKEPLEFKDFCETKSVTSSLYLDMNEELGEEHDYRFVGKAGMFTPIKPGCGGGILLREKDGKYYAATGTKGYRWLESEVVQNLKKENDVDVAYYESLAEEAIETINKFGSFESFMDDNYILDDFSKNMNEPEEELPWALD